MLAFSLLIWRGWVLLQLAAVIVSACVCEREVGKGESTRLLGLVLGV